MSIFKDFNPENTQDYDTYFINKFFTKWIWLFRFKIKGNQDFLAILQLYKSFSVLAMKHNIFYAGKTDVRLFPIVFSNAGSGKGMTNNLNNQVFGYSEATDWGIKIKTIKNPTKEKLIGSWNDKKQEYNLKKDLKFGDERYLDPKIPGYFEEYDDVIFEEALHIFESQKEIQTVMRCVADNYGEPTNYLSSETLKNTTDEGYFAKSSWGTFSYHMMSAEKQSLDLISNGLYQRALAVFIRLDEEQVITILNSKNNYTASDIKKFNRIIRELRSDVKTLFNKYQDVVMTTDDETFTFLNKKIIEMREYLVYSLNDKEIEVVNSYIVRGKNNVIKLACMNALMRGATIIKDDGEKLVYFDKVDITVGTEIVKLCLESVIAEIKPTINRAMTNQYIGDVKKIMGKKSILKSKCILLMTEYWGCNPTQASKRLRMIRFVFEYKKGDRNEKWCKLRY